MPNAFKLANKDGQELAYSFDTEGECLGTPSRPGLFIIEKSPDFFMGYRIAYTGTDMGWQKMSQAINEEASAVAQTTESVPTQGDAAS